MTADGDTAAFGTPPAAGARVPRCPPPLYYAAAFAAGRLLGSAAGVTVMPGGYVTQAAGAGILVAGAALAAAGVRGVVTHRTTIVPHHPVSMLVTTGAYRYSRNPMYAGLAIAYLGGALLTRDWWPLITLPAAVLAVRHLVIAPEERYLDGAFGERYRQYRARVRRWL